MTRKKARRARGQSIADSVVHGDVLQITGTAGDVTISGPGPSYLVRDFTLRAPTTSVELARSQPSRLLLADNQLVPFVGRADELAGLAPWMTADERASVRLLHGRGGRGKTRFAIEAARQWAQAGWSVWQVRECAPGAGARQVPRPTGHGLLAVIDYADRWAPSRLLAAVAGLQSLSQDTETPVRVLLLARTGGYWWDGVADRLRGDHGITSTVISLPPLGDQIDRTELYREARERFAVAMDVAGTQSLPGPEMLGVPAFDDALALQMAALVAVDAHRLGDETPTEPHALSAYLLRRERAHWHALHARAEDRRATRPEAMGRATFAAALVGPLSRVDASTALARVDLTEPTPDTLLDDHRFCYPPADPGTVLQPLQPDRLAEDFIGLSVPGHPHAHDSWLPDDWTATAASRLLDMDTGGDSAPSWAAGAITTLVDTAQRWPHVAEGVLYPLLRQQPRLAIDAGSAALIGLAMLPRTDIEVLAAVAALLPQHHADLDVAAAVLSDVITKARLDTATNTFERARLHGDHAVRLARAGRFEEAVLAARAEADHYRKLARDNPREHLANLARAALNEAEFASRLADPHDIADLLETATVLHEQVARLGPGNQVETTGAGLVGLAALHAQAGNIETALLLNAGAVRIYRRLAVIDDDFICSHLAEALNSRAALLAEVDRDEALRFGQEALALQRRLVAADPQQHLGHLYYSTSAVAALLLNTGRNQEGLVTAEEAVGLARRLAEANPRVHLPSVSRSLVYLSAAQSKANRTEDARRSAREAVTISRRLAGAVPGVHRADLARSLDRLSCCLRDDGALTAALDAGIEATAVWRHVVTVHRGAPLMDLAAALHHQAALLVEAKHFAEASTAADEAVRIMRESRKFEQVVSDVNLAIALGTAATCQSASNQPRVAVATMQDAIVLWEQLTKTDPVAHRPRLAEAWRQLAEHFFSIKEDDAASEALRTSVAHWRLCGDAAPAVITARMTGHAVVLKVAGDDSDVMRAAQALTGQPESAMDYRRIGTPFGESSSHSSSPAP